MKNHNCQQPSEPQVPTRREAMLGYAIVITAGLLFSLMSVCAKAINAEVQAPQIVLARSLFMVGVLAIWLRLRGEPLLPPCRAGLWLLRGVLGTVGFLLFFSALQRITLADTVLLFQATPLVVAALGPFLLAERNSSGEWLLLALSFAGVGLVLGFSGGSGALSGKLMAIGCATTTAVAMTIVRRLSSVLPYLTIALAFPLVAVCTLGPAMLLGVPGFAWVPLAAVDWALLAGVAVFGTGAQVAITLGLRYIPAARATALSHLQVVLAVVFGFLLFAEVPATTTFIGMVLIIGCQLLLIRTALRGNRSPRLAATKA